MKSIGGFLVSLFMMYVFSGAVYAGNTAGVFRLPFDPYQHWSDCDKIGYKPLADQVFMQLYSDNNKYHLAEDWNGQCGESTDLGAVLYAVADGFVENATMGGSPNSKDNGGFLLIRHPLPNGTSRYILYEHIQSIETNPRTGLKFKAFDPVYIGDTIGRLGDGNGAYPDAAHLHFEMRREKPICSSANPEYPICLHTNPYYNPLPVQTTFLYSSPSLFIDDRRNAVVQNLAQSQWAIFAQNANAPSSTAFVEYNGERYSLQRAAQLGYIHSWVLVQISGQWYYYPDITAVFFNAGSTYAVKALVGGTRLNILVPDHNFKADRAKIDMLHRAASDARFTDIKTEIWTETLSWDPAWELRSVEFGFSGGVLTMYHATNKINPLIRFVGFYDPALGGQWNGWTQVDQNTLD